MFSWLCAFITNQTVRILNEIIKMLVSLYQKDELLHIIDKCYVYNHVFELGDSNIDLYDHCKLSIIFYYI